MNEPNILMQMIDWIFDKIPCFLGGHIYTRKIKSGEPIKINGFENKEYTCEKCGKKTIL